MRVTSLLWIILAIKHVRVTGVEVTEEGVVADVRPTTRIPRCCGCLCRVRRVYDHTGQRTWRHLDLAGMRLWLRYDLRRVECPRCGVRVELVPWAEPGSVFTRDFEDFTAYLTQRTDKTSVSATMGIAWQTVGTVVERVVARQARADRLDALTHIGVDELSYRRHHEYVTVVVDHLRGEVVWAHEGKDAGTLRKFFAELGPARCGQLEVVTIDMSGAYIRAVTEASPQAQLVFDRFHVQRLAQDAVDKVRREQVREVDDPEERRALKGTRFALQKSTWNLTRVDKEKLALVQRTNAPLFRAYLLKDALTTILDRRQVHVARRKLEEWLDWASRSRLAPFVKTARTIRKHLEGILRYVATGLSNGRSEGLNGKIRTITRRAYGLHSAASLIALIFLCCSGIILHPPHKVPDLHPLGV